MSERTDIQELQCHSAEARDSLNVWKNRRETHLPSQRPHHRSVVKRAGKIHTVRKEVNPRLPGTLE
jgi:hypothetical protein